MVVVGRLHRVDQLLPEHEALVERAGWPEKVRVEQVLRRRGVQVFGAGGVPGDPEPRQRGRVPRHLGAARLALPRLDGHGRLLHLALPPAVRLLDVGQRLRLVEIAHHHQHGVVGRVEAPEEFARVVVARGHVLDVLEVADDGVAVRVPGVGRLEHLLLELLLGDGGALLVLAHDGARLGAEARLVVVEVLKAVGLVVDDGRQRFGGAVQMVDGHVLAGEGVGVQPQPGHRGVVLVGGMRLGAAEHHVLEEVGEARAAFLHLVAAADAHQRVVGDEPRRVVGHEHHAQPVGQRVQLGGKGEGLRGRRAAGSGGRRHERGEEREQHADSSASGTRARAR